MALENERKKSCTFLLLEGEVCGDLLTCWHRQILGFQPARQIIQIKLSTVLYMQTEMEFVTESRSLGINSGLLTLEFLSGFLPSCFLPTKWYSRTDSSFLLSRFFCIFETRVWFSVKSTRKRDCKKHGAKYLSLLSN
jgi:hypothetical protein